MTHDLTCMSISLRKLKHLTCLQKKDNLLLNRYYVQCSKMPEEEFEIAVMVLKQLLI